MYDAGLTLAIALAAGVLAQSVSRQARLPGIVLLLATGAVLGPEGAGWVDPDALGDGVFGIVDFGIAIILFEGRLNLEWSRLKRQEASIRRLITLGAAMTFAGAAALARLAMDWSWDLSLLFGSLVVVTGPTVVAPLLRDMRLQPRLRTILEAEGVLIDPIGALLAVSVLQVVTRPALDTMTTRPVWSPPVSALVLSQAWPPVRCWSWRFATGCWSPVATSTSSRCRRSFCSFRRAVLSSRRAV